MALQVNCGVAELSPAGSTVDDDASASVIINRFQSYAFHVAAAAHDVAGDMNLEKNKSRVFRLASRALLLYEPLSREHADSQDHSKPKYFYQPVCGRRVVFMRRSRWPKQPSKQLRLCQKETVFSLRAMQHLPQLCSSRTLSRCAEQVMSGFTQLTYKYTSTILTVQMVSTGSMA